ncbi:protein kinase domain-containing protein, partial [Nannocystis pusilla]|uniref:protein kinase domain-containing protein n=1 Tax=Nannocystis pusilla TaxID=889268 RepID=UPI003BF3BE91
MEYVRGRTLQAWLRERAVPRPWREVLDVYVPAGRGLAAAHAVGLVHRDFKPGNAMLGDDGRVRVLDFGLVSSLTGASSECVSWRS